MRLDLAAAQARMAAACAVLKIDPDAVDWTRPTDEAFKTLVEMPPPWRLDPAKRAAVRDIVDALLGYAAHLAFVAGQADERKNAATLLRQKAASLRALVDDGDDVAELVAMANDVERGDRAEEK